MYSVESQLTFWRNFEHTTLCCIFITTAVRISNPAVVKMVGLHAEFNPGITQIRSRNADH
jgi:hypothetical protein